MQNLQQIAQLRRTMRRLAILVALATAVSLPLGYATVSFSNQSGFLQHQATLAAERLAGYIYVQGASWPYTRERLAEIIGETQSSASAIHETVTGPDGVPVVSYAQLPEWPRLSESADVVVAGGPVATVTATETAKPLVLNTVVVGLFALLLAGGALVAIHLLPLRALDETLGALQGSLETIKAHAAETSFAYEELKRQHRLVEETTQELMRTRDQAMAADRTKSAFLATMSHELRTPLNAIIGFSDMLAQEIFGPLGNPRYRDYCHSIGDSGRHLLAVINDVLDISKVEAGKLQLHLEDVDLWQLLDSCSRLVRAKVFEAGVDLHLAPPAAPLPLLRADGVKVKQIALNLMSNALKFTPAGGSIGITLGSAPGTGVFFSIADTGIGMSEAEIALALQPFQQVDNSHTRKYEGTGLGLPLAKALAEQHGGRLEVASTPGAGTVVTVILPQTQADRSLIAAAPTGASQRLRKA